MTTQIGKLQPAGKLRVTTYRYGVPYSDVTSYPAGDFVGTYSYRSPEPSGVFKPNVLKLGPVVMRKVIGIVENSHVRLRGPIWDVTLDGPIATTYASIPVIEWDATLADWALMTAMAKMNDAQADIALMVAEASQTLRMLANPFSAFTEAAKRFKAAARGRSLRYHADVGSALWLQFWYGVKPLVSDIESLMELVMNQFVKPNPLVRKRSTKKTSNATHTSVVNALSGVNFKWNRITETKLKSTACYYTQVVMQLQTEFSPHRFGFDLRQIPALVWETVGYSFVVDWVLSVGTWLKAISPLIAANYLGNCVSQKTELTYISEPSCPERAYLGPVVNSSLGKYTYKAIQLERKVGLGPPVTPVFTLSKLDYNKAITALSLIWQNLPKDFRRR